MRKKPQATSTIFAETRYDEFINGDDNDNVITAPEGIMAYVFGRGGNDRLVSSSTGDLLFGGLGNDTLIGGAGRDRLYGEDGNDRLFGGNNYDALFGGNGNDYLNGGAMADRMYGGYGNDRLIGGSGNDIMHGNEGRDILRGGSGNDRLFGGDGNDNLDGNSGNDYLTGGTGADLFQFRGRFGDDTITDFEAGDRIDLSRVSDIDSFADLTANHLEQSGSDTVINAGAYSITLEGVAASSLGEGDFIFA